MKNNYNFQLVFALIAILFTSCIEDKETTPYVPGSEGFHVAHSGAFSKPKTASVSAISMTDTDTTFSHLAYKSANGEELGGNIEGFDSNGQLTVITTASTSQIIICDTKTLEKRFVVTDSVDNPRYTAFDGNKAYVTVWGPIQPDYSYINPKVLVINLSTGKLENWFSVGSNPEGIAIKDGKLYVAPSYTANVEVYDLSDLSAAPELINIDAAPQHFAFDADNNLWVSATGAWNFVVADENKGLAKLNTSNNTLETLINYTGIGGDGYIKASSDGSTIYGIGAEAWPSTTTEIVEFNLSSKKYDTIITGEGFKGVGQNPASKDIYVAVTPDYENSGLVNVYTETGTKKGSMEVGLAPYHFIFY
ncbi:YncE family protein [Flammeovirga sp. SJP92]|uniref:YncE family protein n=1 Tax=Flammeovirga sp. SJP92 TaxID=1775430 RepID=UPI0007894BEC|nr:hypothetical protein [Flammeovirga sp. SJP92]KXX66990.1 hypothetical protein AVL50_28875 [Flammeovirga sp. SJP92]